MPVSTLHFRANGSLESKRRATMEKAALEKAALEQASGLMKDADDDSVNRPRRQALHCGPLCSDFSRQKNINGTGQWRRQYAMYTAPPKAITAGP